MVLRFFIFLIINFLGLGLGSLFTSKGVSSNWYQNLNQAPWTPPGWVFGAAWTLIMICFAVFMAYRYHKSAKNLLVLFALQWLLNASWNPIFFKFNAVLLGLIVISLLTLLIGYFLAEGFKTLKWKALLVVPYFIWMLIATSLNAYIFFNN